MTPEQRERWNESLREAHERRDAMAQAWLADFGERGLAALEHDFVDLRALLLESCFVSREDSEVAGSPELPELRQRLDVILQNLTRRSIDLLGPYFY